MATDNPGTNQPDPDTDIRPAATVVLMRDSADGLQVLMMRRRADMVFAPGCWVFPGGAVEPSDHGDITWVGPPARQFADAFGGSTLDAHGHVVAAVRETFEECGVLLATPTNNPTPTTTIIIDLANQWWEAQRVEVLAERLSLHQLLTGAGLSLRADLLIPWSRWVTPPQVPRRYDTWFFIAQMPPGQHSRHVDAGEAVETTWRTVATVLAADTPDATDLLPPTRVTLQELAGYATVDDVLDAAASRDVRVHV